MKHIALAILVILGAASQVYAATEVTSGALTTGGTTTAGATSVSATAAGATAAGAAAAGTIGTTIATGVAIAVGATVASEVNDDNPTVTTVTQ